MKKTIFIACMVLAGCNQQPVPQSHTTAPVAREAAPVVERPVLFSDYRPAFDFRILNKKSSKDAEGREVNVVFAETGQRRDEVESGLRDYFVKNGFREGARREDGSVVKKDYLSPSKVRYSISLVPKDHDRRMSAEAAVGIVVSWATPASIH